VAGKQLEISPRQLEKPAETTRSQHLRCLPPRHPAHYRRASPSRLVDLTDNRLACGAASGPISFRKKVRLG